MAFGTPTYMGQGFTSASGTTAVISPVSASAAQGDLVLVWATFSAASRNVSSVSDSATNTYTALTQAAGSFRSKFFYTFCDVGALTSGVSTITMTMDGAATTTTRLLQAVRLTGVGAFDKENTATGTSTGPHALIPATGTFTNARTMLFGGLITAAGSGVTMPDDGGTWVDISGGSGGNYNFGYVLLTSNAQIDPNWSTTNSSFGLNLAGFTEAAAPSSSARRMSLLGVG